MNLFLELTFFGNFSNTPITIIIIAAFDSLQPSFITLLSAQSPAASFQRISFLDSGFAVNLS